MRIAIARNKFGLGDRITKQLLDGLRLKGHTCEYYPESVDRGHLINYNPDIILVGGGSYQKSILDELKDLKMIARAGVGIDSIDITACKERFIRVTNTPTACSNSVAELVIGQMFNLLRHIPMMHQNILNKQWNPHIGKELTSCVVGIIGCGNIGSLVLHKCHQLGAKNVLVNDINAGIINSLEVGIAATKDEIFSSSDIVTLHIPLNDSNFHFVTASDLCRMKEDAILVNTSRGNIINESDLYQWLKTHPNSLAALDVFSQEPYCGELMTLPNILLSPHAGSCSNISRMAMERGACEEIIRFVDGERLLHQII